MDNRFIKKLSLFEPLLNEETAALKAACTRTRQVAARVDLIREGDRPGPVFVILEGWACRYKVLPNGIRQVLAFLMPGDCCDLHVGLLAEMDHSIQTIVPCLVATIEQNEMAALLREHRGISRAMYTSQLVDEGTLRAWITSMGRRTSTERVAHLMCELYLRARNINLVEDAHLTLPLSQRLLADALGMTPVHLNRVLKVLKTEGVMHLKRGQLTVVDPNSLARIAGFDENYLHRKLRTAT